MIRARLIAAATVWTMALAFTACGGSAPPAEPPPPVPEPAPEPAPVAEAPPEPAPEVAPEPPPPPRKAAREILLGEGWDFTLDFANSDLKAKAEEDCKKKAKEDEKKLTDCMSKAEADAANDRIKFAKDDKDNWWFVSLGKQKGKEVIYNKVQVKVASEEVGKLVLTPEGKDAGKKPMKKLPAELVFEMPDEYSVILNHPDQGKLVYRVKVTGESAPKPIEEPKAEAK